MVNSNGRQVGRQSAGYEIREEKRGGCLFGNRAGPQVIGGEGKSAEAEGGKRFQEKEGGRENPAGFREHCRIVAGWKKQPVFSVER